MGRAVVVFVNAMMAGFYGDMQDAIIGPLVGHVQVRRPKWRDERATDLCIESADSLVAGIRQLPMYRQASLRLGNSRDPASGRP